jgi:arylsulfatase A-like enzyme
MRQALTRYIEILKPWLSVMVYLWLLELQAAFGTDAEPLLDQLADSSAILWTLMFWTAVLSGVILLVSIPFRVSNVSKVNNQACSAAFILATILHFALWLHKWRVRYPELEVFVSFLLVFCTVVMALWALNKIALWALQRKSEQDAYRDSSLPTLIDCFYFAALPVIIASALVLAIKITKEQTGGRPVAYASFSENTETKSRPNVILIIADGLRAQNMSVYGYFRKTTPQLEKFAKRSNLYMQMHANNTTTQVSLTTILSGRHPFSHGRLTRELPPYRDSRNLIRILRDNGYATVAISSNRDASVYSLGLGPNFSQGEHANFGKLTLYWLRDAGVRPTAMGMRMYKKLHVILPFIGFPARTSPYGSSDDTLDAAKKVMGRLNPPFFLLVHLHEPHEPYYRSHAFRGVFSVPDHSVMKHKFLSQFDGHYPPELQSFVDHYRDQYDESIQFFDAEFGKFMRFVENSRWSENLLIGVTADHGESFERGYLHHGEDLYENSTRIPLLIRFPNQRQARRVTGLVQSTDIAPTILNAIGVAIPPWMDGQALTEDGDPNEAETIAVNFKHPVRGVHYPLPTKLAIWLGRYKMIALCDGSKVELYDLAKDPEELVDLSSHSVEIVQLLKQRLALRLAAQSQRPVMLCSYH